MSNGNQFPSENLIYEFPDQEITGDITLFKQIPQQAGNLLPSNTLSFQIASRTEFVDVQRSYLQMTITPTGGSGTCYLQNIGATSVIGQVQEQVCGTSLQFLNRYDLYNATKNAVTSVSRKQFIGLTEGYVATGSTAGSGIGTAMTIGTGKEFVVPCPLQTITSNKLIPLSLFPGDYLVQILLNPVNYVFGPQNTPTSYTISNVYMVLALVTPPREMFLHAQNTLNNGGDILLPISICRNFEQNLAQGTTITFNQIIGYYESLDAITICRRLQADITEGNVFWPTTNALTDWYISLDTERFPKNRSINAEGSNSQENLLQVIRPFNTQLDDKTPYATTGINGSYQSTGINSGFSYWNFQENASFGSGKAVSNGQFVAYLNYNPSLIGGGGSDVYDIFIEYSILLRITAGGVSFNSGSYA